MRNMNGPIHVFGHLNPDSDSTCAAIGYAYLKNKIDLSHSYIPAVLGKINDETAYVLEYFNVTEPKILLSLKPQVVDMDIKEVTCVHEKDPIQSVLEIISNQAGRSVPVVDDKERLIGIVSISDIVPIFLKPYEYQRARGSSIPLRNIIGTLGLTVFSGHIIVDEDFCGQIYIFNDLTEHHVITRRDMIICNQIEFEAGYVLTLEVGYIVVGDLSNRDRIAFNSDYKGVVFISEKCTYDLVIGAQNALPIASMVKKEQIEYFTTYETLDDVKKNMLSSKHQRFPVVDEWGYIKGMISKGSLVDVEQKKAILVDHNERGQSIEGIDAITIVEVIDHHRVADIQTISPLYFRVEPVGSTCTIIAKIFHENAIEIPKKIAGVLLSGILSDTLIFKSPTCTEEDKKIAAELALLANVSIHPYGMKMLTKGEKIQEKKPEDIISSDMKKFTFGQYKVVISQVNIGDFEGVFKILPNILRAMEDKAEKDDLDLVVLMLTTIVIGGTELIAVGKAKWIADNAFGMRSEDTSIFLNDTFSRKKQVVPKLMKFAQL